MQNYGDANKPGHRQSAHLQLIKRKNVLNGGAQAALHFRRSARPAKHSKTCKKQRTKPGQPRLFSSICRPNTVQAIAFFGNSRAKTT
ncbi:hypothetical protein CSQ88_05365 [Iodobacter sp. BJB302]|nr:hypothetical protein CSQ88_05365 [Iodobacter sp. BJB302]